MPQQELLIKVVHALQNVGIDYMVTGSIASSLYGEPRSTHDIDLLVRIHPAQIEKLMRAFPESDYYIDEESIHDAIALSLMFNLIDVNEGDKVDFWMLTDDPFDQSRFARKIAETLQDIPIWISTPEDTILAKLKWAKLSGGSEKQMTDALRIYEVQFEWLDQTYLETWAKHLGLEDLLSRLKADADPL